MSNQIAILARRMRTAFDQLPRGHLPYSMQQFPAGACGDTSILLGAYLVDCGHLGFEYICGTRGDHDAGDWTTHAWLARGDLVVDITADQFVDAPAGVIVESPSIWHRQFDCDPGTPSDFRAYFGPSMHEMHAMYSRLQPLLAAAKSQSNEL
jgi:hypothetical protein